MSLQHHTIVNSDGIVDYRPQIDQMPVRVQVKPGDVKSGLPAGPPTTSESLDDLMLDLKNIIVQGLTQVQHQFDKTLQTKTDTLRSLKINHLTPND